MTAAFKCDQCGKFAGYRLLVISTSSKSEPDRDFCSDACGVAYLGGRIEHQRQQQEERRAFNAIRTTAGLR